MHHVQSLLLLVIGSRARALLGCARAAWSQVGTQLPHCTVELPVSRKVAPAYAALHRVNTNAAALVDPDRVASVILRPSGPGSRVQAAKFAAEPLAHRPDPVFRQFQGEAARSRSDRRSIPPGVRRSGGKPVDSAKILVMVRPAAPRRSSSRHGARRLAVIHVEHRPAQILLAEDKWVQLPLLTLAAVNISSTCRSVPSPEQLHGGHVPRVRVVGGLHGGELNDGDPVLPYADLNVITHRRAARCNYSGSGSIMRSAAEQQTGRPPQAGRRRENPSPDSVYRSRTGRDHH